MPNNIILKHVFYKTIKFSIKTYLNQFSRLNKTKIKEGMWYC